MVTGEAEKKWEKAKSAVDKSKYPDDDAYWKLVTTVFKKMMHEELSPGTFMSFDEFVKTRQNLPKGV